MITVNLYKNGVVYRHQFKTNGFARGFTKLALAQGYRLVRIEEIA